jgi:hypothetical protein
MLFSVTFQATYELLEGQGQSCDFWCRRNGEGISLLSLFFFHWLANRAPRWAPLVTLLRVSPDPRRGAGCITPMRIGTVVGRQLQHLPASGFRLELLGTTFVLGPHVGAARVTILRWYPAQVGWYLVMMR